MFVRGVLYRAAAPDQILMADLSDGQDCGRSFSQVRNFIGLFLPERYPIRFSFATDDSPIGNQVGKRANLP